MAKGTRQRSEARKFEGERALKPTIQLTDNGFNNRHMGLACPTFTSQGGKLLFISDRDGASNFFRMDLYNFETTQLTGAKGIFAGGAWYCEKTREIFYWERTTVKAVNVDTLEERAIYDEGYQGSYLSASCDGRYVAFGAKCDAVPGFSEETVGRYVLMVVSTQGEGAHPALTAPFEISRVQFSPVNPQLIVYCWEGIRQGVPQRIWSTDIGGLHGGPLGAQSPNEARGDEFFSASGERVGYHGNRYHTRNDDGAYFVEDTAWVFGFIKVDGAGQTQYECHGPTGQCQLNNGENMLVCSQGGSLDPSSQSVALLRPVGKGGAVFDPLFYHGAKNTPQWVSPRFRPGDEEVVFTSDFLGCANIFLVSTSS